MLRSELSVQVRPQAPPHRQSVRIRRCQSVRGPEEHALSGRHDARLEGFSHPVRLRVRESPRQEALWLRYVVYDVTAQAPPDYFALLGIARQLNPPLPD